MTTKDTKELKTIGEAVTVMMPVMNLFVAIANVELQPLLAGLHRVDLKG